MPLLVSCACGRKFQAKDEYAGKQAKCPACGQVLVIQGVQVVVEPAPRPAVDPEEEAVASRAQQVLRERELQRQADARFMKKIVITAGVVLGVFGIGMGIYLPMQDSASTEKKTVENKPAPEPAARQAVAVAEPAGTKNNAAPAQPAPAPAKPQFDKSVLGQNDPRRVRFSGPVVSGMTDDGAMVIHLNTETLPSGSTSSYRAKLKMREAIVKPIPAGVTVTFEATTTPGMTQTTDFDQNDDGTRRVDAIYTATFVDAVILSTDDAASVVVADSGAPAKAEPAAPTSSVIEAPKTPPAAAPVIPSGPPKNDVDRYIYTAMASRDGHARVNALIFSPDDPRLNFEFTDRKLPLKALELVHAKLEVLEKPEDLESGPAPSEATDQIEARMLMDDKIVGSGIWLDGRAEKDKFLVFLDPCQYSMPDIINHYGPPGKTTNSGHSTINFYGRMALVVFGGKVHAVARRVTKAR